MNDPPDTSSRNHGQGAHWQGSADAMDSWHARELRGPGKIATELMFKMAQIGPGKRVLEVGAGTGNETLEMAELVGPKGIILATDISAEMIATATRKSRKAGYMNVELMVMDAANLDVPPASFDAAISRMGLMLFPDPEGALGCMWEALVEGGRVGAMVFSVPQRNPVQAIPTAIIGEQLGLPVPDDRTPGFSRLADKGLLSSMLEDAGFDNVAVEAVGGDREMTAADIREFVTERSGITRTRLAQIDDDKREEILEAILRAMEHFRLGDRYVLPQEFLVASGRKAASLA